MEYLVPGLFLLFGFGAALLIRRMVSAATRRGRPQDVPLQKGAVPLESIGKKRRR